MKFTIWGGELFGSEVACRIGSGREFCHMRWGKQMRLIPSMGWSSSEAFFTLLRTCSCHWVFRALDKKQRLGAHEPRANTQVSLRMPGMCSRQMPFKPCSYASHSGPGNQQQGPVKVAVSWVELICSRWAPLNVSDSHALPDRLQSPPLLIADWLSSVTSSGLLWLGSDHRSSWLLCQGTRNSDGCLAVS